MSDLKHKVSRNIPWEKMRQEYIFTSATIRSLATKYGCSKRAVDRRSISEGWVSNGETSGTIGEGKRLEGIMIKLENLPGGIEYRTHVEAYGWLGYVANGAMSGTTGEAKRLEAIDIRLTGAMAA